MYLFTYNITTATPRRMPVRVETNLSGTSAVCVIFYSKCITRKCLTLKMKVKVTEYNIHNDSI